MVFVRASAVMPCTKSKMLYVEDRLGRPPLLRQDHLDHLAGLALGKAAPTQEHFTLILPARDDPFAGRLDAGDEGCGRGVGEAGQRRCCLVCEALRRKLRVPDGDLLEVFGPVG